MHAIGSGILILETQQSSDTTYRVYDFDRKDDNGNLRELHLEKSIDVLNIGEPANSRPVTVKADDLRSTLIGRYGNRIAKGRFQLNGKEYKLAINNGPNSLHGGKKGFNAKVWDAVQVNDHAVVLKYTSSYGEEGYTGEVNIWVAYSFSDNDELIIKYSAKTNKKTIINLTSHGFFSLAGIANPTPTIDDLECQINADFYLPIDETSIPTGEILKVAGTPFDFREPKTVGQDIDADHEQIKNGAGYDHCFVLNKKEEGELSFAARIKEPKSGRTMEGYLLNWRKVNEELIKQGIKE